MIKNKITQHFLLALFCATQITNNTFGMRNKQSKFMYREKKVTEILKRHVNEIPTPNTSNQPLANPLTPYLDELENVIEICQTKVLAGKTWGVNPPRILFYKKVLLAGVMNLTYDPEQTTIDLNSKSKNGNTLLHLVTKIMLESDKSDIYSKLFEFTQYLLEHNATPNIQNNNGETAFLWCMRSLYLCSNKYLQDTPLTNAVIDLLLDAHADPAMSSSKNCFLSLLAERRYSHTIERILELINIKHFMNINNEHGETPAHTATRCFNIPFLCLLANAGADFHRKDAHGRTPLECALEYEKDYVNGMIYGRDRINATIELLHSVTNMSDHH